MNTRDENETKDNLIHPAQPEMMLSLVKAMADEGRLRVIGLLAVAPRSQPEIESALDATPDEVARHLKVLQELELVKEEAGQYSFSSETITAISRQVLVDRRQKSPRPEDFEGPEYDRKILSQYVQRDGRLKTIPTQLKKVMAILRYVVQDFQPDERYSEKQVNERLKRYHEDYAMLRRYLVDYGFLEREGGGGAYWLKDAAVKQS